MKKAKKNHSGISLIEMLVAISIFTIGILGFTLLFSKSWQSNSYILEMGQSSFTVSQGLDKMVAYLRKVRQADDGSYPIKSADDNDLVVYSDYDSDGITERLHFYFNNGKIMMGATKPNGGTPNSYPADDQSNVTLAEHIVNNAGTPVFYYYNQNYPGDVANNPLNTPAAISEVRLIKVLLEININPNRAPDNINMESFAEMRNLNDYDRVQ